jgi:hypothetical protein
MRRDTPGGHPLRVERQHDLVHIREPALPFLDNLRLERALPIPRHVDLDLTDSIRDHGLRPSAVPHVRRLPANLRLVLLVAQVPGHLLVQRGFQHIPGKQLQQTIRAGQGQPPALASATIAAAAACSGDSSRADFPSLLRRLTRSDVITHGAHPARPQPGVSGQKHRFLRLWRTFGGGVVGP